MSINARVTITSEWTQLTTANATSITFQNLSAATVYVQATVGATPPAANAVGLMYGPGMGEIAVPLSELAPGISATRVYARIESAPLGQMWVSHA